MSLRLAAMSASWPAMSVLVAQRRRRRRVTESGHDRSQGSAGGGGEGRAGVPQVDGLDEGLDLLSGVATRISSRRLTDGQRRLVVTAATSGRQLELVLGVAGAGKTTALDALRASFEDRGHRVIGTATSGQAARTLGDAAHLA